MFIYSTPILFTQMQVGTPFEFIVIILFLYGILFISTPYISSTVDKVTQTFSGLSLYKYLLYAWTGQLKLWIVFWPFFILLNFALFGVDNLTIKNILTVSSWDDIHFILITPIIFWTIAVWRNSIHTDTRYWAAAARLMTLTVFFEYGLKFIIRKDYPRLFFSCQELMLDYAGCF